MSIVTRSETINSSGERRTGRGVVAYLCGGRHEFVDAFESEYQHESPVAFLQDQAFDMNEDCGLQSCWPAPVAKQGSD